MQRHAPFDTAVQGAFFIQRKIAAAVITQQNQDVVEAAAVFKTRRIARDVPGAAWRNMAKVCDQPRRQFRRRRNNVRQPGVDHAAGHAVELGRARLLRQHQTALRLDRARAQSAIGTHAGKNHPGAAFVLLLRQRQHEKIYRQTQDARRRPLEQMQAAAQNRQILVGRNHIHRARREGHAVSRLNHRQRRAAREQLGQHALAGGIEMLNHHKRHAAIGRHGAEKLLQRFKTTRRRADANNGKRFSRSTAAYDRPFARGRGCFGAQGYGSGFISPRRRRGSEFFFCAEQPCVFWFLSPR